MGMQMMIGLSSLVIGGPGFVGMKIRELMRAGSE
jgi:hypothetical protein